MPSHDYVGAIGNEAPFKSKEAGGVGTPRVGDPYRMVKPRHSAILAIPDAQTRHLGH